MRDYTEHRTPIREIGRVNQVLSEAGFANVDVRSYEEYALRQMVVEMQAFALHGAPQEITLRETVEVEVTAEVTVEAHYTTVEGVWRAICVYWLLPAFMWLVVMTDWVWLYRLVEWADDHRSRHVATETATNTETEQRTVEKTQTVHRTMCPHVPTEERHHHLRWVDTYDPRVPFPDADSVRQAFENLLHKDDLTYSATVVVDAEEYMALTRMGPNDPVPLRQFMGMDILVEGINAFRLEYDR